MSAPAHAPHAAMKIARGTPFHHEYSDRPPIVKPSMSIHTPPPMGKRTTTMKEAALRMSPAKVDRLDTRRREQMNIAGTISAMYISKSCGWKTCHSDIQSAPE